MFEKKNKKKNKNKNVACLEMKNILKNMLNSFINQVDREELEYVIKNMEVEKKYSRNRNSSIFFAARFFIDCNSKYFQDLLGKTYLPECLVMIESQMYSILNNELLFRYLESDKISEYINNSIEGNYYYNEPIYYTTHLFDYVKNSMDDKYAVIRFSKIFKNIEDEIIEYIKGNYPYTKKIIQYIEKYFNHGNINKRYDLLKHILKNMVITQEVVDIFESSNSYEIVMEMGYQLDEVETLRYIYFDRYYLVGTVKSQIKNGSNDMIKIYALMICPFMEINRMGIITRNDQEVLGKLDQDYQSKNAIFLELYDELTIYGKIYIRYYSKRIKHLLPPLPDEYQKIITYLEGKSFFEKRFPYEKIE